MSGIDKIVKISEIVKIIKIDKIDKYIVKIVKGRCSDPNYFFHHTYIHKHTQKCDFDMKVHVFRITPVKF